MRKAVKILGGVLTAKPGPWAQPAASIMWEERTLNVSSPELCGARCLGTGCLVRQHLKVPSVWSPSQPWTGTSDQNWKFPCQNPPALILPAEDKTTLSQGFAEK